MKEQPLKSNTTSVRHRAHVRSACAVLRADPDGGLTEALRAGTPGAERLYGFRPEEALGRVSHTLLQTKFPIEVAELSSQLQNGRYWSGEVRHTCKDGREVVVDSRMQLLDDGTVLEVNRDVTEIKALVALTSDTNARAFGDRGKVRSTIQPVRHFRRRHGLARLLAGGEQLVARMVRLHTRASSGPSFLGNAMVEGLGGGQGKDPLCNGSGGCRVHFSRRTSVLVSRWARADRGFCDEPHSGCGRGR